MTQKTRILRIIARLNVGGPSQHVLWLTQHLSPADSSFETTLVTGAVSEGEKSMDYLANELNIQPIYLPKMSRKVHFLGDILSFFSLLSLCFKIKPHIIHTHTAKAGALGRVAALLYRFLSPIFGGPTRVKVFHTFHGHVFSGYFSPWKTQLILWLERLLALLTHRILVLSPEQQLDIVQTYKITPLRKTRIVRLGLDLKRLDTNTTLSQPPPFFIAWIGRVTPIKDPFLLLEIAKIAQQEKKPWIFWIIGGGELLEALATKIQQEKLPVEIKGFQSNIALWVNQAHAVLLTSKNEGTPLSLIESLYLNKPIVSTAVGGVPSLLADNRGTLINASDPQLLFSALKEVLEHPLAAKNTKNWVQANYSIERLVQDLTKLYSSNS